MKKVNRPIALLLCIIICAGLFAGCGTEAEEQKEIRLLSIGDSTSNGYFLNDYGEETTKTGRYTDGVSGNGRSFGVFLNASRDAYPSVLAEYISKETGCEVKLTELSLEGMRTDELRAMLDPSFYDVAMKKGEPGGKGDTFLQWHVDGYSDWFAQNFEAIREYTDMASVPEEHLLLANDIFTKAVKEADIITLDVTMNNFGTYLTQRLQAVLGGDSSDYTETIEDLTDEIDIDILSARDSILRWLKKYVDVQSLGLPVDELIGMFLYCYADFRVNFLKDVELIRELNPDVQLIVVGSYNAMAGLKSSLNGIEIDFGSLWASLNGLINTFLTNNDYAKDYSYANCSGEIQTYIEGLSLAEDIYDVYPSYAALLTKNTLGEEAAERIKAHLISHEELEKRIEEAEKKGEDTEALKRTLAAMEKGEGFRDILEPAKALVGLYIKSAKADPDMGLIFAKLSEAGSFCEEALAAAASGVEPDWETEVTPEAKTFLHMNARFLTANGMGAHPDGVGSAQKSEAVIAAFEKTRSASSYTTDSIGDIIKNLLSVIFGVLKHPVSNFFIGIWDKLIGVFA